MSCEREQLFSITVYPALTILCGSPPNAGKGAPYYHLFPSTGAGPLSFALTAGALPGGLTLNAASGVVSGVPTVSTGTFTFTIQVTDIGGNTNFVECSIKICPRNAQGVM